MKTFLLAALLLVAGGLVPPASSAQPDTVPTATRWALAGDDCGPKVKKRLGYWRCAFHDDFSGTALDRTKWVAVTSFVTWSGTTNACYRDDPSNVSVADGVLNLTVLELDAPVACAVAAPPTRYVSGGVSTYHLFSQQYGRLEARIRTTAADVPGLHEAFWLWPDDRYSRIDWPDSGEIDVAESFSAHPSSVGSYLHYSADHAGLQLGVNAANCPANRGEWNTFTVEWGPSRIETFVNGTSCLVNTSGDAAFRKRYIVNLTQGIGGGDWNLIEDTTPMPATTQVDYVRVWK
jgi:beta-glucanase (GH16 family)